MTTRTVKAVHPAERDDIGDLITRRPLPSRGLEQIDPFLFLNHHGPQVYPPDSHGLPFGPHPHRGFETVTFILEGSLAHRDTGGHESIIHEGGVQWMTAGRGLEHSEVSPEEFKKEGGPMEILQLWVNLPARLKMVDPRYVGLQRDEIPTVVADEGRVTIQVISGTWGDCDGPVPSLTDTVMTTIEMQPGASLTVEVPPEQNIFLYVVRGRATISGTDVGHFQLAEMSGEGDEIEIEAVEGAFLLFGHAPPIGEPVVAHGPFVMNSVEEIMQAIKDYEAGLMRS